MYWEKVWPWLFPQWYLAGVFGAWFTRYGETREDMRQATSLSNFMVYAQAILSCFILYAPLLSIPINELWNIELMLRSTMFLIGALLVEILLGFGCMIVILISSKGTNWLPP